jgi:hypothetical protein
MLAKPAVLAALVFVMAFSLYGVTTSPFLFGYEGENAAVAEGLVRTGDFRFVDEPSPLRVYGGTGEDGRVYGRSGFSQALLEAPFYAAGWALDSLRDAPPEYRYRELAVRFYNPFAAGLTAALVFLIVLITRRSTAWAIAIAAAFTFASIAWPYSKIGMDTTLMLGVALSFLAVLFAARSPGVLSWALVSPAVAFAAATKPYGLVLALPLLVMLWEPWRRADREMRARLAAALIVPLAVGLVALGLLGGWSFGRISGTPPYEPTWAAPLNAAGFFLSPGKGLFLYSPLVILGVLGLVPLWREQRTLAIAIVGVVAAGVAVPALTSYWSDETWGPRYLVPVAWLLLVPLAWWGVTRLRRIVIVGLAIVGVAVQVVAVTVPYEYYVKISTPFNSTLATDSINGLPYTAPEPPALGHDSMRWVPELSPILWQARILLSTTSETLGGSPSTFRYAPYAGKPVKIDLRDAERRFGIGVPDFWWVAGPYAARSKAVAALLFLLCVVASALLAVAARRATRLTAPALRSL